MGEADRGEEVQLEEASPLLGREIPAWGAGAGTEIGDQVVEAAEVGERAVEGAGDGLRIGEVAADGKDAVLGFGGGELGLGGLERGFVAASEDNVCAFGEERGSDGAADASGGAGDESDLAVEMKVHGLSVSGRVRLGGQRVSSRCEYEFSRLPRAMGTSSEPEP